MSQLPLQDKVVLITGAGKGVGSRLARAFAAAGATLALNDISPINVEALAAGLGGAAQVHLHDVAKKVAVQSLVNDVGHIDVLVNCANVEPRAGLLTIDEWDLHRVFEVNAIGAFLMMQSVGRVMRAQGGGVMLNVLPLAGHETADSAPAFYASRMALAGLTRAAAPELTPHNIHLYALTTGLPELASHPAPWPSLEETAVSLAANPVLPGGSIVNF